MDMNWYESIIFGFFSGLTDILPVSSQAHRVLMLKFFGKSSSPELMNLLIHIGMFAALYYSCRDQLIRMRRARALARVPKRKRRRPLDTKTLMDVSLLKTMLIPVVLSLFVYQQTVSLGKNMILLALFLVLNGIILYVPQFLPSGNRDSRTLSRVEGLLMGLGGAVSVIPGISAVGAATSVGSVCGVERGYCVNMALLMNLAITVGMIVYDLLAIFGNDLGTLSAVIILYYIIAAAAGFLGTVLGIKVMRHIADSRGASPFALYCVGLAMFTFIMNLMA